jgi:hypothetical protein
LKTEYCVYQNKYRNSSKGFIDHENYKEYNLEEIPKESIFNKKLTHCLIIAVGGKRVLHLGTPEEIIKKLGDEWELGSIEEATIDIRR